MRKVFDRQTYVRAIGEKEWHRTSVFKHLSYQEEKEITIKIIQYDNFKDTLRYVETDEIYNAEIDYTLFRNRPYINIYHAPKYSLMERSYFKITEKNFVPIEFKIEYEECEDISLDVLKRFLTAKEYCDFINDNLDTKVKNMLLRG